MNINYILNDMGNRDDMLGHTEIPLIESCISRASPNCSPMTPRRRLCQQSDALSAGTLNVQIPLEAFCLSSHKGLIEEPSGRTLKR